MARAITRILTAVLAPFGQVGAVCEECLGPRRCAGWLVLRGDEEPAKCSACHLPVDRIGRSVVSPGEDGRPVVHSIRLIEA